MKHSASCSQTYNQCKWGRSSHPNSQNHSHQSHSNNQRHTSTGRKSQRDTRGCSSQGHNCSRVEQQEEQPPHQHQQVQQQAQQQSQTLPAHVSQESEETMQAGVKQCVDEQVVQVVPFVNLADNDDTRGSPEPRRTRRSTRSAQLASSASRLTDNHSSSSQSAQTDARCSWLKEHVEDGALRLNGVTVAANPGVWACYGSNASFDSFEDETSGYVGS
eukprot:m.433559 g.433559  ORF g.433559 m.433559 type:complete len:217 (+) comp20249_c0_seq1:25-675(+)